MKLTDLSIRALSTPEKGAQIYYDDTLPGFGVRVSEGGTKSFILTHGARRRRETIGRVGIISLSDARTEAKRRLAEYTLGKSRPKIISWASARDEYLAGIKAKRKPRTYQDYTRLLELFPFGDTRLTEISPDDLQRDLDKLADRPAEHQHAFVVVRAFLNACYRRNYIEKHPMARMKPPHRYKARERILTDEELTKVWRAAQQMGTFGKIVRLLVLTGQRRGEIVQLTTDMIGDDTITFPSWLTKNSIEHTIPLCELGRSELTAITRSPHSPSNVKLVFTARGKEVPFNGWSKSKAKLDKLSGVPDWTLHDLRRTFASGLAKLGVQLHVVERLLNHVSGSFAGIVGVYQRHNFMAEMRDAVHKWEAHITKLTAPAKLAVA
jgi:integrase